MNLCYIHTDMNQIPVNGQIRPRKLLQYGCRFSRGGSTGRHQSALCSITGTRRCRSPGSGRTPWYRRGKARTPPVNHGQTRAGPPTNAPAAGQPAAQAGRRLRPVNSGQPVDRKAATCDRQPAPPCDRGDYRTLRMCSHAHTTPFRLSPPTVSTRLA